MSRTRFEAMKTEELIKVIASPSPTPGGGTVGALCGALSAALSAMVASLTTGKDKYRDLEPRMREIVEEAGNLSKRLLDLMEEDARAFDAVMEAYRLPKGTEEERAKRKEAIERALRGACEPPMEVLRLSRKLVELASEVEMKGNKNAITDAAAAAACARAAAEIAFLNALVNLNGLSDEALKSEIASEGQRLLREVERESRETFEDVLEYLMPDGD